MRILLLCFALTALGQSKPNFSGHWSLNLAASDYSAANANKPDKITVTIQHKGDYFKYKWERVGNGRKGGFDVEVTVGGPPYESDAAGIVSLEWKGESLIVSTLYNPGQDRQSDQVETWTLSADRKRLTDDVIVHPPNNGKAVHIVRAFDKE